MAERWAWKPFVALRPVHLGDPVPGLRQLDVGRRLARQLGLSIGPGRRLRRLRRIRRRPLDRRLVCAGRRDRPRPAHRQVQQGRQRATRCRATTSSWPCWARFILAFGWFGFNPGSHVRCLGQRRPADRHRGRRDTMLASGFGPFSAMFYTWWTEKQAEPRHDGQRHARRPRGDHRPVGLRRPVAGCDHRRSSPASWSASAVASSSKGSRSTTRSAPSRSTASTACGACSRRASSPTARRTTAASR